MKHLFLPYNLALLAKEKGFDEECLARWENFSDSWNNYSMWGGISEIEKEEENFKLLLTENLLENYYKNVIKAPLYQQVIDWFREKHGIQFAEFPWKIGNPVRYGLHRNGEFLGGFELDKAIETAFKLI